MAEHDCCPGTQDPTSAGLLALYGHSARVDVHEITGSLSLEQRGEVHS